jgi:hypothetical protein
MAATTEGVPPLLAPPVSEPAAPLSSVAWPRSVHAADNISSTPPPSFGDRFKTAVHGFCRSALKASHSTLLTHKEFALVLLGEFGRLFLFLTFICVVHLLFLLFARLLSDLGGSFFTIVHRLTMNGAFLILSIKFLRGLWSLK